MIAIANSKLAEFLNKSTVVTGIILATTTLSSQAQAGQINLSLTGMCSPENIDCVNGVGSTGLFTGDLNNYSSQWKQGEYNWVWDGLSMTIDTETGDASIAGNMVSAITDTNHNDYGQTLGINIQMTDLEFQGDAFASTGAYDAMVADLITGGDQATWLGDLKNVDAINWNNLTLSLTGNVPSNFSIWGGMADDNSFYCDGCVAQLGMTNLGDRGTELHFGAWYNNNNSAAYNFGDTKAVAMVTSFEDDSPDAVPEPSVILGTLAALGMGRWAKQKQQGN
jgi:hypothetical protein